jgi:hypothetical protein
MNKKKLTRLIPILILTLITVVMWISLDVVRLLKKTPELVVPTEVSQPLTPTLDESSINQIESRIFLNDSQIPENIIGSSPTPGGSITPEVTLTPEATATPSATIQPVSATGSGTTQ